MIGCAKLEGEVRSVRTAYPGMVPRELMCETMTTILAGDIGGTKCNLALFLKEGNHLRLAFQKRLATRDYTGFQDLLEHFLRQHSESEGSAVRPTVEAAAFGVAGVLAQGRLHSENLPWVLDIVELKRGLNLKEVILLNDLTATALSIDRLPPKDFVLLNQGNPEHHTTRGVVAAGTGLGEAMLFWDGNQYRVAPSEAGQGDFAPRNEREIGLLRHLQSRLDHVSWEEVISGRGFRRIHEFLDPSVRHLSFESSEGDSAGEITQKGLEKTCPICLETLAMWTEIYGAAAGNFALQSLALGGIYIAGGIAVRILPKLQAGSFFQSFCGKGKLAPLLARIPISVLINEDAPVWGVAYQALLSNDFRY